MSNQADREKILAYVHEQMPGGPMVAVYVLFESLFADFETTRDFVDSIGGEPVTVDEFIAEMRKARAP